MRTLLLALVPTAVITSVAHGATLVGGLGGAGPSGGYGSGGPLYANDDGSSSALDISPAFPMGLNFFGNVYTSMYVNTNGNITFKGALSTYTPNPFPVASQPMIAPFWGDVDTRGGGMPTTNGIWWHIEPGRVIVTWSMVGYYRQHDNLKNDFQLILTASTCGSSDFDVEFRYHQCQWITGDASGGSSGFGGTPAQAGFDAGDNTNFVIIPSSRTADVINLCTTSNVGEAGIYRFQIRNGAVAGGCAGGGMSCDTGKMGVCAAGINQCAGASVACNPMVTSSAERCDGLDNDCNGAVDDGDSLCPEFEMCDRGVCVAVCRAEIGCPNAGDVCTDRGSCVEAACAAIDCPAGQRCKGGICLQPCDGVVCPHGQVCRVGRCVDPCSGVTCGMNQICVGGACVPTCQCKPCESGFTCQPDGSCVETSCVGRTCSDGHYCAQGGCLDSCTDAVCPDGQICETGQCVPAPPPDLAEVPDLAPPPDMATPPDFASAAESDTRPSANAPRVRAGATGCDVSAGGSAQGLVLMLVLLALLRRRFVSR